MDAGEGEDIEGVNSAGGVRMGEESAYSAHVI